MPTDSPSPKRGGLPVVFFEFNVVLAKVNPDRFERLEIEVLHVVRRRLENDLQLRVLEKPVGVFAIASISGTP